MNATSATDTALPALQKHCGQVQTKAVQLRGVLEAMAILDNEGVGANAVTSLMSVAFNLAEQIGDDLDSVNLPKGGAA